MLYILNVVKWDKRWMATESNATHIVYSTDCYLFYWFQAFGTNKCSHFLYLPFQSNRILKFLWVSCFFHGNNLNEFYWFINFTANTISYSRSNITYGSTLCIISYHADMMLLLLRIIKAFLDVYIILRDFQNVTKYYHQNITIISKLVKLDS